MATPDTRPRFGLLRSFSGHRRLREIHSRQMTKPDPEAVWWYILRLPREKISLYPEYVGRHQRHCSALWDHSSTLGFTVSAQETYGPPPSASWDRLNRRGLAYQGDICGAVFLGDMSSFLDHASNYWFRRLEVPCRWEVCVLDGQEGHLDLVMARRYTHSGMSGYWRDLPKESWIFDS
jgi:hypothetical protein